MLINPLRGLTKTSSRRYSLYRTILQTSSVLTSPPQHNALLTCQPTIRHHSSLLQWVARMPFYAVAKGVVPGVYTEWSECQKQVNGFRGPQFKKFGTLEEAEQFIEARTNLTVDKRKTVEETANEPTSTASSGASSKPKKSDKKKESASSKPRKTAQKEDFDYSSLPPELQAMHAQLKLQQKHLSKLRDQFDTYVEEHHGKPSPVGNKRSRSVSPDQCDDGGGKRMACSSASPDGDGFEVLTDGFVSVFTDGCCENNGRGGAKAGVGVWFGDGSHRNISAPVEGRATNNAGEIQAVTLALKALKQADYTKALINTDSMFVIQCMTSWIEGWKKRGWRKADGGEVINKEDLIDLDMATDGMLVKWAHVKGHSGIHGNEMADQLAKQGAKSYVAPS